MYSFCPCPVILSGGEVTGELDSLVEETSKQLSIHMVAWLLLSTSIRGQWKGGQSSEQKGIHDIEATSQERVVFAFQNW